MLKQALGDANEGVRLTGVDAALQHNTEVDVDDLMPFLKANLQTVNIVIWVAHHAPERLGEFTAHLEQRHHKALSDHLRTHIKDSMDPLIQTLLDLGNA